MDRFFSGRCSSKNRNKKSTLSSKVLFTRVYQNILSAIQQERECQAIVQRLLHHYFQLDSVCLAMDQPITLSLAQRQLLYMAIKRLNDHEPIQYILGEAFFLDRAFHVNPAVLIPRPETEAMVQSIINDNPKKGARVLDIGTGSGCIAITLQQALPQSTVHALEVDPAALQVARTNALKLGVTVHFIQADILKDPLPAQCWDIIVSNPPYVRLSERMQIHRRVLDYEPARALFVPDVQPLLFYEKIVHLASCHLIPAGKLYVEINEAMGAAVTELFGQAGFTEICIHQDIHAKERWVTGTFVTT